MTCKQNNEVELQTWVRRVLESTYRTWPISWWNGEI